MAVDLGIENLRYLIFGLTINNDRCRGGLNSVRNGVREAQFQHGNMKDRMDRLHRIRQMQYDRVRTCSADDFKRTEILISKLLSRSGRAEELSLDEGRRTNREFGVWRTGAVGQDLVSRLSLSDMVLQGRVQLVQINSKLVSLD